MSNPFEPFRVDFSNFYKFVSSVGLVLIAAAAAVPWFIMKAAAPETASDEAATAVIDSAILIRAEHYLFAIRAYPWVSGSLFLLGLILVVYGLFAWKSRQKKQDADEDETFRQRRTLGETQQATDAEKDKKLDREAADAAPTNAGEEEEPAEEAAAALQAASRLTRADLEADRSARRAQIINAEVRVGQLLRSAFESSHSIEAGVRIQSPDDSSPGAILDFVARANDPKRWTSLAVDVRFTAPLRTLPSAELARRFMLSIAVGARGVPEGPLPQGGVGRPALAKAVSVSVIVVDDASAPGSTSLDDSSGRRDVWWRTWRHQTRVINSVLLRRVGVIVILESTLREMLPDTFRDVVLTVLEDPSRAYLDPRAL